MDYDNNDFQTQNFHLGSDENTKFPSFLQLYALPKFDLDEHLQVRLQLGSVVDSEVLLGDQYQEENNWIENFSGVISGIEFGSHATASCSSLRHKNVLSEAASSETVEMLLKSVGQDSVIKRQSTVEESNTFDGLDSVDNKMERPTFNQDNSVHSKVIGTADADSTPPSDKISPRPSSQYFQECHSVECLPLRSNDDKCGCMNSRDLDLSSVDQKFGSNVHHTVEKCGLVQEETSLRSYEVKVAIGNVDFVVSERMQIGPSASSGHNVVIDSQKGCNDLVSCGNQEWLVEDTSQKGKHQILRQDGGTDNRHSDKYDVKSCIDDLGGSCSLAHEVSSLEQIKASPAAVLSEKVGEISHSDTNQIDSNGLSNFMNSGNQSVESTLIDLSSAVRGVGGDKVDLGTGGMQAVRSATTSMEDVVGGATVSCTKLLLGDKLENLQDVSQQGLVPVLGQHSHIDGPHCARLEGHGSSNVETSHSSVPKTSSLGQKTWITGILLSEKLDELLTAHTDLMDLKALKKDGKMSNAGCLTQEASSAATEDDLLNHYEGSSSRPIKLSKNTVQPHSVEDVGRNLSCSDPHCGQLTAIDCSKASQSIKEFRDCTVKGSSCKNILISDGACQTNRETGTIGPNALSSKDNSPQEERNYAFVVGSSEVLSIGISTKGQNSFSNIQGFETHKVSGEQKACRTTKVSGASKSRSESGGAPGQRAIAAGRKRAKQASLPKTTKKVSCTVLANSNGSKNGLVQEEEVTQNACVKDKSKKLCMATAQMSALPDLNTSASPITMFQQPFTDFQQVQLRAQIFVYGSLIQAKAPDEACMISAFADTSQDSGHSMWENVWRAATERTGNQKSTLNNPDAPIHSHSGARNSKSSPIQNLSVSSTSCRSVSRGTPSAVVNPSVSSATWNFSNSLDGLPLSSIPRSSPVDSHQRLSPLHSSPTVHIRPCLGNSSLHSQFAGTGPLVTSQTSVVDVGTCLSTSPIVEAIKVTSVRDSSSQCTSSLQLVSSSPLTLSGNSANVPSSENLAIEEKLMTPEMHASTDQNSKKRKKSSVAEVSAQISPAIQPQSELVSSSALAKSLTISECIISPSLSTSVGVSGVLASTSSPIASSMCYQVVGSGNTYRQVIFSEETCSQIEHAKLHAEDAASLADSAVKHQESVWNLLAAHQSSGFLTDVEEKLASAAVAAAVAASVAKAAAAAAKVASNAALQAKLMADEALVIRELGHPGQDCGLGLTDVDKNPGRASASVLNGMVSSKNSSAVIIAAREATRKRVEATSAAAKRAENLDAVVKAAELAAEAVSQVGVVAAMGDPIPLRLIELVEAGPDGYWKSHQKSSEHPMKVSGILCSKQLTAGCSNGSHDINAKSLTEQPSCEREVESTDSGNTSGRKDPMVGLVDKHMEPVNTSPQCPVLEADDRTKLPPLTAQNDKDERPQLSGTSNEIKLSNENDIKEGSLVEVVSDEDGLRGVWFSARVLSLKDGKAYVSYMDLLQDEGRGQLKEWIPIVVEGDEAPRIRIAHPMTATNFEGTRKRRRAAIGNYGWSVGDHVDVWMRDGWWEGVVTEKNSSDGTNYTIHFPADGDSSIVRAWNLRPSLTWKDGRWIEWCREKNYFPPEVATPEGKRQKLDQDEAQIDYLVEAKENKHSENLQAEGSGEAKESRTLTDENCMVRKNWKGGNISDTVKMKRIGLQKEGSRVVFGIPKPGKKKKFMEVSKHYIADGVATTSGGASTMKFGKYVVSHGSNDDYKEKKTSSSRRGVFDSGKDQSSGSKHTATEDGSSVSMVSSSGGCMDVHSFTKGSFSDKVECGSKGKQTVVGEYFARDGENIEKGYGFTGNPIHDGTEPRRSSRRIQPTSRLLEGLQSSFLISQIPALSHGKSAKAQYRSISSSRGSSHR